MSNKNVRVRVRVLIDATEIRDKSDIGNRPGKYGATRRMKFDVPEVEIPFDEFLQRLEDAQIVMRYGNVVAEALPPVGVTDEATLVTHNSARLNCTVTSQNVSTAVAFQYGTTEALGTTTAAHDTPLQSVNKQTTYLAIAGLTPGIKYYYRVRCISATKTTYGLIKSFMTEEAPA